MISKPMSKNQIEMPCWYLKVLKYNGFLINMNENTCSNFSEIRSGKSFDQEEVQGKPK